MMRIAVNLLGYAPGRGGVDTYLGNLLHALQRLDQANSYLVLCDPAVAGQLALPAGNFSLQTRSIERPHPFWLLRGVSQRLCGYDPLAWMLRKLGADVMHHPLTTLNPPGLPYPSVLTFHDLQHEFFPELFEPRELARRCRQYPASVEEAAAVIAISRHVKDCLVSRYGTDPEKIFVVYHGVAEQYRRPPDPAHLAEVAGRYALRRPFAIYPAATWAHKNHQRLLAAVQRLVRQNEFDGELLLTGLPMGGHELVMAEIGRLGLEGNVRWLGYVPGRDLPALYALARLLVFPSLFEGFGLPVLEAMACGCPVAAARASALPEIGGEAVEYFDPLSVDGMASAVSALWNDERRRELLRQQGCARAAGFDWLRTAEETLAVYQRVAGI